jgi:biotin carboxylase
MRAEVASNFRDKNRMKDVLRKAGVPVARQALVHGGDDARAFVQQVGYPIVLKPLAGFGARNTQRAHDEAALTARRSHALLPTADNPAQAEEFVQGEEHTFEAVVIAGKTVWSSSTEYVPSPLKVLENPWMQYALILPRETAPAARARLRRQVNARTGRARHAERPVAHGVVPARGRHTGRVEVGARPPGANIMPLLPPPTAPTHGPRGRS